MPKTKSAPEPLSPPEPEPVAEDNSFQLFVAHQRSGDFLAEVSEALRAVAGAVWRLGKPGKLVIELTAKPVSGSAIAIADKITIKAPEEAPDLAIFYVSDDGALSRKDPRQREFAFRQIKGGAPEDSSDGTAAANQ